MAASILANLLAQQQTQFEQNQALIVLGLQNDFISPEGKLPVSLESGFLDRIKTLVPQFREFAGDIIWVRSEFHAERSGSEGIENVITGVEDDEVKTEQESTVEIKEQAKPPSKGKKGKKSKKRNKAMQFLMDIGRKEQPPPASSEPTSPSLPEDEELFLTQTGMRPCCLPGTTGAALIAEVEQLMDPNDIVIVKSHYSAFNQTQLRILLHMKKVTELYIVGCITNLSIFATAQDAASCGMVLNIVEDCLGYRMQKRHDLALQTLVDDLGAYTTTSTDILATFSESLVDDDGSSTPKNRNDSQDPYDLSSALERLDIQNNDLASLQSQNISEVAEPLTSPSVSSNISANNRLSLKLPSPTSLDPQSGVPPLSQPEKFLTVKGLRSYKSTPDVRNRANVRVRVRRRQNENEPSIPKVHEQSKAAMHSRTLSREDEMGKMNANAVGNIDGLKGMQGLEEGTP